MGQYLLGGAVAKIPYVTKELNISIYTAEELCYYIYHNLTVLEDDFIQNDLVEFIRTQLSMPVLAERMERYYQSQRDRDMMLVLILREVAYYSEKDIVDFQEQLVALRRMNPLDRKREQADLFADKGNFQKAIRIYEKILNDKRDLKLGSGFYGRVYQHMAVCYAGLFRYDETMKCLSLSYKEAKSAEVLKQMYFLSRLQKTAVPREVQEADPRVMRDWEAEWVSAAYKSRTETDIEERKELFAEEEEQRQEKVTQFLDKKKQQYREMADHVSV
ncbi:MAG: hypothetical protein MSG78_07015 [Clostridiales bacterium]|nr:hypothetical protein [Clostridiales bacterium]